MNSRTTQNIIVISVAAAAAIFAVHSYSKWLDCPNKEEMRERCYGIVKAGKNDCANGKHSCAQQGLHDDDPAEWVMVPNGLCEKSGGKKVS